METIEVIVRGKVGLGKSHIMAVIERALLAEYGDEISIKADELVSERGLIGEDIANWQRPEGQKVKIELIEKTYSTRNPAPSLVITSNPSRDNNWLRRKLEDAASDRGMALRREYFGQWVLPPHIPSPNDMIDHVESANNPATKIFAQLLQFPVGVEDKLRVLLNSVFESTIVDVYYEGETLHRLTFSRSHHPFDNRFADMLKWAAHDYHRKHEEQCGDIDLAILLRRENDLKVVTQASILVAPLLYPITVDDCGLLTIEFKGKRITGALTDKLAKQMSAAQRLDRPSNITMNYMVRSKKDT